MDSPKEILNRIASFLVGIWYLVVVMAVVALVTNLATQYTPNYYLWINNDLTEVTLVLAAGSMVASAYQKVLRNRSSAAMREEFNSRVNALAIRMKDVISSYIPEFPGFDNETVTALQKKYWPYLREAGQQESEIDFDIASALTDKAATSLSLQTGQKYFLFRQYLERNLTVKLKTFTDSLNQSKFTDTKSPEYLYFSLVQLDSRYPNSRLVELAKHVDEVNTNDVKEISAAEQGQAAIYSAVKEIAQDKAAESRYVNLKRIVQRLIVETHVSEAGLLSLMDQAKDLVFVMKSEAGVGGLKTVFKKAGEVTPFKKVLLSEGFVQVGLASAGSFVIPASKLRKEYQTQIPLYMERVIIPKVETEWARLQATYGRFKRINRKTYSYISFRVRRSELKTSEVGTKIKPQVSEMFGSLSPDETADLLASQRYEIPRVLERMEIDAITDFGTNNMKNALRSADQTIRNELKEAGNEIRNITDFRNVDISALAGLIQAHGVGALRNIAPKARRTFDTQTAHKIAGEIISNATDLYNITRRLGTAV